MENNHSDGLAEDDAQLIPEVVATKAIDESSSEMLMSINDFIDAKSLEERYSTAQTDCSCMSDDPVEVTSDESQEDGDADSGAEEKDDDEDEHSETDEGDIATEIETYLHSVSIYQGKQNN
ncbi:hypothetical protein Poli38472_012964 [Pythium oligandrum]|uniref:Uncharacterized protein n=1 Tax=Pythium oligandrum TaxID=41045 RepID=A0A8K1CJ12_PYTOL|nr:hypothetical protein Poli38472_012964 [Pythium oligandrum]|eukprot:TMW64342.1 hypothetical protein Poli38472_012964 [Pythium oligandrum]